MVLNQNLLEGQFHLLEKDRSSHVLFKLGKRNRVVATYAYLFATTPKVSAVFLESKALV